jgi:hypothetical protein
MVNWLGLYFELNEVGRKKRRSFTARHSNSLRARHPSHSCIVLALVVVVSPPFSVVKEVYNLVFFLVRASPGMGFLTLPSMIVTIPFESIFGSDYSWSMCFLRCYDNFELCIGVCVLGFS